MAAAIVREVRTPLTGISGVIVGRHHGTISLRSAPREWTRVGMWLPAELHTPSEGN
jgi:signal transduction histidine kinase